MRCLLIEDDTQTVALIQEGLIQAGHEVTVCHDGAKRTGAPPANNGMSSCSTACCPAAWMGSISWRRCA